MASQTPPPFKSPYGPPGTPVDTRKLIHFQTDGVPPPSALYLDVFDSLLISIKTADPTHTYRLSYRILLPDGEIIMGQHILTPTVTNRTFNQFTVQLTEGFLLGLDLGISPGPLFRGRTSAAIFLLRGPVSASVFLSECLTQGVLDNYTELSWPAGIQEPTTYGQGYQNSVTGTTPGAGVEITEVVPVNARWVLKTFRFTLTTSATVATRGVTFTIDDGTNALFQIEAPSTQPASVVQTYNYGAIGARADKVYGANVAIPIPPDLRLLQGWRIRTSTAGLQAGDQYTAPQYYVEEYLCN